MLSTSRLTRTIALAIAVAAIGPGSALARPADVPPRPADPVTVVRTDYRSPDAIDASTAGRGIPARVEGMGVRPTATPTAPAPAALPLARVDDSGGIDVWSLAIGASAMLALLLTVALVRSHRPRLGRARAHA